jgi:hypothetical protein
MIDAAEGLQVGRPASLGYINQDRFPARKVSISRFLIIAETDEFDKHLFWCSGIQVFGVQVFGVQVQTTGFPEHPNT